MQRSTKPNTKPKTLSGWICLVIATVFVIGRVNDELRYKTRGHAAQATVTKVTIAEARRTGPTVYVRCQFMDIAAGSPGVAAQSSLREEWIPVPIGGRVPAVGDTIQVEYIPGVTGLSRLPSPPLDIPLAPLLAMLVMFAIGTALIIKQGKRDAQFQPAWNQHHQLQDVTSQGLQPKQHERWPQ